MLTKTLVSALALAASVLGQNTSAIPQCALTCVLSTLPTSPCVSVTNLTCICTSTTFQYNYYQCQQSTCSATDLASAEAYGAAQCQANGTPINITAIPSSPNASSSSVPVSSGSAVSTHAASSSASKAASASGSAASASASAKSDARREIVGAGAILLSIAAGLAVLA